MISSQPRYDHFDTAARKHSGFAGLSVTEYPIFLSLSILRGGGK